MSESATSAATTTAHIPTKRKLVLGFFTLSQFCLLINSCVFVVVGAALFLIPKKLVSWYHSNSAYQLTQVGLDQARLSADLFITVAALNFVLSGVASREATSVCCLAMAYGLFFSVFTQCLYLYADYGSVERGLAKQPFDIDFVIYGRLLLPSVLAALNLVASWWDDVTEHVAAIDDDRGSVAAVQPTPSAPSTQQPSPNKKHSKKKRQ